MVGLMEFIRSVKVKKVFRGNNSQNTGLVNGKDEAEIRW